MTELLSRDETYDALIAKGVPHEKARVAAGFLALPVTAGAIETTAALMLPKLEFPIRLELPWTALISENRRFCAHGNRIFMTVEYKAARAKVKVIALQAMQASDGRQFPPLARPVSLHARVWFPDKRVHDAPNFAGATHNALKKIVVADDVWIYRATWERAGVDQDKPRAEIEIAPVGSR